MRYFDDVKLLKVEMVDNRVSVPLAENFSLVNIIAFFETLIKLFTRDTILIIRLF